MNFENIDKKKKLGKKNKLSDISISEVSLVDSPANERSFILYKRLAEDGIDLDDLSDDEFLAIVKALEALDESFDEIAADALLKEAQRLSKLYDALLFEQNYKALSKAEKYEIKYYPARFSWENGKIVRLQKTEPYRTLNATKTHYWDSENARWIPVKGGN